MPSSSGNSSTRSGPRQPRQVPNPVIDVCLKHPRCAAAAAWRRCNPHPARFDVLMPPFDLLNSPTRGPSLDSFHGSHHSRPSRPHPALQPRLRLLPRCALISGYALHARIPGRAGHRRRTRHRPRLAETLAELRRLGPGQRPRRGARRGHRRRHPSAGGAAAPRRRCHRPAFPAAAWWTPPSPPSAASTSSSTTPATSGTTSSRKPPTSSSRPCSTFTSRRRSASCAPPPHTSASRAKREAAEGRRVMRKVVNITSIAGTDGNAGQAGYSSGKAAVIGLHQDPGQGVGPLQRQRQCRRLRHHRDAPDAAALGRGAGIDIAGRRISVGVPQAFLENLSRLPAGPPRHPAGGRRRGALLLFPALRLRHRRSADLRRGAALLAWPASSSRTTTPNSSACARVAGGRRPRDPAAPGPPPKPSRLLAEFRPTCS